MRCWRSVLFNSDKSRGEIIHTWVLIRVDPSDCQFLEAFKCLETFIISLTKTLCPYSMQSVWQAQFIQNVVS